MSRPDPIGTAMQSAVDTGVFPGAVLMVRVGGRIVYHQAFGLAALIPKKEPAGPDTVYDLASLTKPLATTTAILCLVQDDQLGLDDPLEDFLDTLKGSAIGKATVSHLLGHRSGLPAWRPIYEQVAQRERGQPGFLGSDESRQMAVDYISRESLLSPVVAHVCYSDLGFILLGALVERLSGRSLALFCRDRIYGRIGAEPLFFVMNGRVSGDGASGRSAGVRVVAPTEDDPWRGRVLRGEVHDENAFAMGGVAGHAGLFGTAVSVLTVAGRWLRSYLNQDSLLSPDLVRRFARRQDPAEASSWGMGWDTPSKPSASGTRFSSSAFGHLGYTGTSLWIDPTCELEVILLSNRVHPTRRNERIQTFRPCIHDLIFEEWIRS